MSFIYCCMRFKCITVLEIKTCIMQFLLKIEKVHCSIQITTYEININTFSNI